MNIIQKRNEMKIILLMFCVVIFSCSTERNVAANHENYTYTSCKNSQYDSVYYYQFISGLQQSLKIKPLNYTTDTFHFRFWRVNQAIDIWTNDFLKFYGLVTSFYEDDTKKKKPLDNKVRTVKQQQVLDSVRAKQVYNLVNQYKLVELPDADKIEGWRTGLDGFSYITETSTSSDYNFKTYWSPNAQDSTISEAQKIINFDKQLEELLNLENLEKEFFKSLPSGSYHYSGTIIRFQKSVR